MSEEEIKAQAEKDAQAKLDKEKDDIVDDSEGKDGKPSADSKNPEDEPDDKRIPYSRFKDKVDEVNRLSAKLDEIEKVQEEQRVKELTEQEKYKELYEEALKSIEEVKSQNIANKVESKLKEAGYKDEQITRLSKLVEGETEEEIMESIEDLKIAFPTKTYVDPSPDQRKRHKPEGVDGDDIGKSIFDRLKDSGKLKGFK